jgi:hypothetical protein
MLHDMGLHHVLRDCSVSTTEGHLAGGLYFVPAVVSIIIATVVAHGRAAEGQNEGSGKSQLRPGEHCRISLFG